MDNLTRRQSCGSGFIESGSGYGSGSSISSESGSNQDPWFWLSKTEEEKNFWWIFFFKNCNLLMSKLQNLQLVKENIQHFKKWNFLTFLCFWAWIRIANPDPDTDPGTPLNPDPIRIRILSTARRRCIFINIVLYPRKACGSSYDNLLCPPIVPFQPFIKGGWGICMVGAADCTVYTLIWFLFYSDAAAYYSFYQP